jgi:hypothetical protein
MIAVNQFIKENFRPLSEWSEAEKILVTFGIVYFIYMTVVIL